MHIFLIFLFALISCSSQQADPGIELTNAWIRETPPGANVAALYLEIQNKGPEDSIVSVSSPLSKTAEIHSTEVAADGTGSMVRQETVILPSGKVTNLSPGGLHIMLIGLEKVPAAGEKHEVEITFKNSGKQSVVAEVKGFDDSGHDGHHDHHHMDH